jgi:hypothetical protein
MAYEEEVIAYHQEMLDYLPEQHEEFAEYAATSLRTHYGFAQEFEVIKRDVLNGSV